MKRRWMLIHATRLMLPLLILVTIFIGSFFQLSYGTICTFTIGPITVTCPLGFVEISAASRRLIPELLIPAAIAVVATILFGRVFCGWICPAGEVLQHSERPVPSGSLTGRRLTGFFQKNATRMAVLGSVITASAIFQYPVFCVMCPVGIITRNVISLSRYGSVNLDLAVIPVIIAMEWILAPWCAYLCPIGTILHIFSKKSPVAPIINRPRCISCSICTVICKMRVNLLQDRKQEDCSRCLKCGSACPTKAIGWKRYQSG